MSWTCGVRSCCFCFLGHLDYTFFNETLYCGDNPSQTDWKKVKYFLPCGRRTSTSHSAWSLKRQENCLDDDSFTHTPTYTSKLWLMSAGAILNLDSNRKTTASQWCYYNKTVLWRKAKQVATWFCDDDLITGTGELRNHRDVFLLWVKCRIMRRTGGDAWLEQQPIDGSGENLVGEGGGWDQHLPCYPLAALFAYIKRRGLVSQRNSKGWVNTHL